jgi:multiple sugar transport system ATP-binding protein
MEIRLENVTKAFPNKDGSEVIAVNNLNVVIPSGKLVGLLGPSGCGKSTTLYMIAGLHTLSKGKIYFGDEDVTSLAPEKRGIGLVFQNYALYPHMTVYKNIKFPLDNVKIDEPDLDENGNQKVNENGELVFKKRPLTKEEKDEAILWAAKLVQIDELLDRKPSQLSGGQQQRVAIARALVKKPRVLLLDEPLSNLDARLRLQTREEIKRIQRETGITTIFVTHDQEEALSISDEIVVMNYGVKQQVDEPQTVYNDPANLFVAKFLGTPPINCFAGEVKDKAVYIDNEKIYDLDVEDQKVTIGIRPEGFIVDEKGCFTADISMLEHIGRDISLICTHDACEKPSFRVIVDADTTIPNKVVKFNLKSNKVFVFNVNGERIN